jgi:hypothetical protein
LSIIQNNDPQYYFDTANIDFSRNDAVFEAVCRAGLSPRHFAAHHCCDNFRRRLTSVFGFCPQIGRGYGIKRDHRETFARYKPGARFINFRRGARPAFVKRGGFLWICVKFGMIACMSTTY